jgi:hypothetical protein
MNQLTLATICIFGSIALFVVWGLNNAYPQ